MQKELVLTWVNLPKNDIEGVSGQHLDFFVSGESLKNYLGIQSDSRVTPFGWFNNKQEQLRVLKEFRLQAKSSLVDNRIELYICAACGDIGCGSITTKVIDRGDKIVWAEFANQNHIDEIHSLIEIESIEFDRQNYFQALSQIK